MITTIIKNEKLDVKNQVKSVWKSVDFIAEKEDEKFNCEVGKNYRILICLEDTTSKSGKEYKKGNWFIVETEN